MLLLLKFGSALLAVNERAICSADSTKSSSTTDTLNVANITNYFAYKFRVMLTTPGFVCGDTVYSQEVRAISSEDWDEDGIPDPIDLDDDNDGILDTDEGEDIDLDGDGIPNSKDVDSDGDGCFDTFEAGYDDPDVDGVMGTSPVTVNTFGMVDSEGPYMSIGNVNDSDENGTLDFLEIGSDAVIVTQPISFSCAQLYFRPLRIHQSRSSHLIHY